jgi:HlyD family secretion protein
MFLNKKRKVCMKKGIIAASSVVFLAVIAVFLFNKKTPQIRYETEAAIIGDVKNVITATGKVQPLEQVEVSTQVSGIIDKIFVDFNDRVKANQVIAILDKSVLELQVAQSNAALSSAQSEYNYRKSLFERANIMKEKNMISADEYELVKYNYERSQNSLQTAKIDNDRAKTNLGYAIIRSPIDGIVLSRAVEQGQTVAASLNAPTLFTIARDLTKMQVLADIDEADIGQIKDGMNVKFSVDAWADSVFAGVVQSIRLQPNNANSAVSYTVVINADNSNFLLLPGMTATAEIITSGVENVLVIPARALRFRPTNLKIDEKERTAKNTNQNANQSPDGQRRERQAGEGRERGERSSGAPNQGRQGGGGQRTGGKTSVWTLENDIPVEREIQTGERSSSLVEVRSGLERNDRVIVAQISNVSAKKTAQNPQNPQNPLQSGGNQRGMMVR